MTTLPICSQAKTKSGSKGKLHTNGNDGKRKCCKCQGNCNRQMLENLTSWNSEVRLLRGNWIEWTVWVAEGMKAEALWRTLKW